MGKFTPFNVVTGPDTQTGRTAAQQEAYARQKSKVPYSRYMTEPASKGEEEFQKINEAVAKASGAVIPDTPLGRISGNLDTNLWLGAVEDPTTQDVISEQMKLTNPDLNMNNIAKMAMEQTGNIYPEKGITPLPGNYGPIGPVSSMTPEAAYEAGYLPVGPEGIRYQGRPATVLEPSWMEMSPAMIIDEVGKLQKASTKMGSILLEASKDVNNNPNRIAQAFKEEFGSLAQRRKPTMFGIYLAYLNALEKASYGDFTDADKEEQRSFEEEYDMIHPMLYKPKGNRDAINPRMAVMENELGNIIEESNNFKFANPENKKIISQAVLRAASRLPVSESLITDQEFEVVFENDAQKEMLSEMFDLDFSNQNSFRYRGLDVERKEARNRLRKTAGLRAYLTPGFRRNVRTVPKKKRDLKERLRGPGISGVSPSINMFHNFLESTPNQFDAQMVNALNAMAQLDVPLGTDTKSLKYFPGFLQGKDMKINKVHINILNEQAVFVKDNAADGKTFYKDVKLSSNGRTYTITLAQEGMKALRYTVISTEDEVINLAPSRDKYSSDEKALISGIMYSLGYDTSTWNNMFKAFKNIAADPNSPERRAGRNLNIAGKEGSLMNTDMSPADLQDHIPEGLKSLQALRALDSYLTAKEKGNDKFLTRYLGSIDAQQSGKFIQDSIIGNILGMLRGGGRTKNWLDRANKDSNLEAEKLYEAVRAEAAGIYSNAIDADINLSTLTTILFGEGKEAKSEMFSKAFAKESLAGVVYGQGSDGSIDAVVEAVLDYLSYQESGVVQSKIRQLEDAFNEPGIFSDEKNPELIGSFSFKSLEDRYNSDIGKALLSFGELFDKALDNVDPQVREYSNRMRDIYNLWVDIAVFAEENGLDFPEPQTVLYEPADPNNPYNSKMVKGIHMNMLDHTFGDKYEVLPFEGTDPDDDTRWQEQSIYYQKQFDEEGNKIESKADIKDEQSRLKEYSRDAKRRARGITKFPAVSIHAMDNLIMAIAVNETVRKYNLPFVTSVWDGVEIPVKYRDKFSKEYNKALKLITSNNNFFEILPDSFEEALAPRNVTEEFLKIVNQDPRAKADWRELREKVKKLQRYAREISINKEGRGTAKARKMPIYNMDPITESSSAFPKSLAGELAAKAKKPKDNRTVSQINFDLMNQGF